MIRIIVLTLLSILTLGTQFAQTGTTMSFNSQAIAPGDLQHKILCLEQGDTFGIKYTPENPDEQSKYVIGGLELWAQVSMGQPKVIGRIGFSEPADQPELTFTLEDFKANTSLPDQTDATRVTVRVAQILRVQGKRMLGYEPLSETQRETSFMLIKQCQ